MADENVLFVRGNERLMNEVLFEKDTTNADEDVWDDSALIKAYDKAVNLAKEEVVKRMSIGIESSQAREKSQNAKDTRHANKPHKKWTVGAPCRAIYSEDGEIYEASILKIYESTGTCIVKFIGYGNTEKVELESLLESEGLQSQIAQQNDALVEIAENPGTNDARFSINANPKKHNGERMDYESEEAKTYKYRFMPGSTFDSGMDTIPPAPPLPPQLMAKLPDNDADALSSMLMSWYISGFHTGYYHGLKQAQTNQEKRENR